MRYFVIFSLILALASVADAAESVMLINRTGEMFRTVWIREAGSKKYEQVARALWSNTGARIYVEKMPFYIAVSKRDGRYSFIGPFDRDYVSKREAQIEILERHVYETKSREMMFWCPSHQRWETHSQDYSVAKPVKYVRITGLRDAVQGATDLRDSESIQQSGAIQKSESP